VAELDRLPEAAQRDVRRQRGQLLLECLSASGLRPAPGLMREVRNLPGSTRLTVMPSLARSGMIVFISPAMPGRIPFDRSMPPTGCFTELDWIPMMRPHCCWRI
jgi:hypothetical protein